MGEILVLVLILSMIPIPPHYGCGRQIGQYPYKNHVLNEIWAVLPHVRNYDWFLYF